MPRSLSFSGAGFLGSYHAGVYAVCASYLSLTLDDSSSNDFASTETLIPKGLMSRGALHLKELTLLGSSAGSLVAAGIATGQHPDDMMAVSTFLK